MNKTENTRTCSLLMCWHATVLLFYFKIILLCSSTGSSSFSDHCMNENRKRGEFGERGQFGEFLAGVRFRETCYLGSYPSAQGEMLSAPPWQELLAEAQ